MVKRLIDVYTNIQTMNLYFDKNVAKQKNKQKVSERFIFELKTKKKTLLILKELFMMKKK